MKKITFILICLAWLFPFALQAQTATQPAGSGTASGPYQVTNLDNSDWVASVRSAQSEPTVTTTDASNISANTAQSGGAITSDGGSSVTAKGVVWDKTGNPDITSNLGSTNEGSGTGSFTSTLTGLSDTTVYYVRAYATNSDGTGYGDVKSFTTKMSAPPTMAPPGNALNFDGTDDYVGLPNEPDFDFTNAMTVAAWIKVTAFTSDWQPIVTKGDGSWRLQRYSNTDHMDFGTTGLSNVNLEGTTDVVTDGKWHYIVGVFDGSTKYLYVDGNLDASASVTGTISTNDYPVEIGENSEIAGRNFDGLIDEVRIWNVARTQTEIQNNMNNVLTGNESGLVAYYKFDMSSGTYLYDHSGNGHTGRLHNMVNSDWVPSGWMQAEPRVNTTDAFNIGANTAQSGGNIINKGFSSVTAKGVVWDKTGNPDLTNNLGSTNEGSGTGSFTSTLTGLSDTTVYYVRAYATNSDGTGYGDVKSFTTKMSAPPTMAPPGNALNFDGADDYVLLPNKSDFDFTNAMTVAAWIKVPAFTKNWQAIVTKGDNSWRLQRCRETNAVYFGTTGLSNEGLEGTTDVVTDGKWHYIVGVFDGSTKYLYVDGNLDASASVTGTISTNNYPVEIGENSQYPGRNFKGLIDEVRIWNVARTQTEIQNDMNNVLTGNESGLVAYYKFDMSSGTYLYDHSGNGHTGRLQNMANSEWVPSGWTVVYDATWTGASSTDWNDAGNWSGTGGVPSNTDDVDIPSVTNQPVIKPGDNAQCRNLTIESGTTLTLASDATGNGALIMKGSEAGDVTVQRYIAGYNTSSSNGWHEVAAPFDMAVSTANFLPGNSDDLFSWDETTYQWDNYKVNHFNFVRGKGYLVSYGNTAVHSMTGTLNSTGLTWTNISYTPSKGKGWQLLGNPFPCPIKWNDGNWALNNVGAKAETYNEASGNYAVLSAGDIIPSTNGFFVQVDNTTNSLTIPASARTFSSANNFKSVNAGTADSYMSLKVTGEANSYYDVTKVSFHGNATEGWDQNYDAHKMFGAQTAPQLWTVSDNENFALNTLPPPKGDFALPLDFKVGVNSTYHLTWSGIKNIPDGWEVLLEDVQTDKTVNMRRVSEYDFKAATTDSSGRFMLHINSTTGISNTVNNNNLSVYALRKAVYLKANGNEILTGEVVLYNLWGQQVYKAQLNGTRQQVLKTGLDAGIYVARVKKGNDVLMAKKVLIR